MITSNIINRCLPAWGEKRGTAFIIDYNEQQYWITARHVLGTSHKLRFYYDSNWNTLRDQEVVGVDERLDIAVVSLAEHMETFPVELGTRGMTLGESSYLLGFPLYMN